MEEQKNKLLKKGLLEPDTDFTSKVMNSIDAEETVLSNLLAKHGSVTPSSDFTSQLMQQLEGKSPVAAYAPVISKKAWIGIAAVFIGIICLTIFFGTKDSKEILLNDQLHQFTMHIDALFSDGSAFPYLMLGILILSIGLVLEQKLSAKVSRE